jgi:hypothetical protein
MGVLAMEGLVSVASVNERFAHHSYPSSHC